MGGGVILGTWSKFCPNILLNVWLWKFLRYLSSSSCCPTDSVVNALACHKGDLCLIPDVCLQDGVWLLDWTAGFSFGTPVILGSKTREMLVSDIEGELWYDKFTALEWNRAPVKLQEIGRGCAKFGEKLARQDLGCYFCHWIYRIMISSWTQMRPLQGDNFSLVSL